jgi:hypothetical protein
LWDYSQGAWRRKRMFVNSSRVAFAIFVSVTMVVMAGSSVRFPEPNNGSEWNIYTVDTDMAAGVRPSLVLDRNGSPHISYYAKYQELRYARWIGDDWDIVTVDTEADNGWAYAAAYDSSLALDSNGYPHIIYRDEHILKYARWTGIAWDIKSHYLRGGAHSMALDSNDIPHVAIAAGGIHYGKWTATFSFEHLDSRGGGDVSIALDKYDNPHISYYIPGAFNYTRWTGLEWEFKTLDTEIRLGWLTTSIAVDSCSNPHMTYNSADQYFNYTRWTGLEWEYKRVEEDGYWMHHNGVFNSLALDSDNFPHVSYSRWNNGDWHLRYARRIASTWIYETVDSDGVGWYNSIDVDSDDNPHIAYWDIDNEVLKYATKADLTQIFFVQDAGGPYAGNEGSPVVFDGSGSYDPEGDPLQYRWDFDDDGVWDTDWSYNAFAVHTWNDDYVGTVNLEVTDLVVTKTDTASITVSNVPPTVSLGPDLTIDEGDTVVLSTTAVDPSPVDVLTYEWDLNEDGLYDDGTGQSISWTGTSSSR